MMSKQLEFSTHSLRNACKELNLSSIETIRQKIRHKMKFQQSILNGSVLIQRTHYYALIAEEAHTIRWSVLIEEGALTKEVR